MNVAPKSLRAWFEAYLAAFNRGDFDGFGAYYADDVIFHGQAAQLRGKDAVLGFYRMVRARLDEQVELVSFVGASGGRRIAAELRTTLLARRDWLEMPTGPMRAGDTRQSVNIVFYDLLEYRFTRVRSARLWPAARPSQ